MLNKDSQSLNQDTTPASVEGGPVSTTPILVKSLVLLAMAVLVLVLYRFTPLKAWLEPAGHGAQWFRSLGWQGAVLFTLMATGLILLGVPRLLFCPLAGALYGFWLGLGLSLLATMTSYYAAFLWIRGRRHKGIDARQLPRRLAFLAGNPGFTGVVFGRLLPMPGMVVTMALAVSNVGDAAYLFGSALGLIPEAIPAVMMGTVPGSLKNWGQMIGIAILCIMAVWLALRYIARGKTAGAES